MCCASTSTSVASPACTAACTYVGAEGLTAHKPQVDSPAGTQKVRALGPLVDCALELKRCRRIFFCFEPLKDVFSHQMALEMHDLHSM